MEVKVTNPSAGSAIQSVSSEHNAIQIPWGPVRSVLEDNFSFGTVKTVVASAGLDMTRLSDVHPSDTKGELMTAIDQFVGELVNEEKSRFASILIQEMIRRRPDVTGRLDEVLRRVEWSIVDGHALPIKLVDRTELEELPPESRNDLVKAAKRFQDGDLSGSISAACGAVDSITSRIYAEKSLSDAGSDSFQTKVARSLDATGVLGKVETELVQLGWDTIKAEQMIHNLRGALNQASNVMQALRSGMGDVHGTKDTLKALVFDSLQWSKIILRIFTERQ